MFSSGVTEANSFLIRQSLISLADRIVMNPQVPGEFSYARKLFPGFPPAGCNEKSDLVPQLLEDGNFTVLVDTDAHVLRNTGMKF